MANQEHITDLQAVDYAFGKVLADCYTNLGMSGPEAWQRFIKRKSKDKIFLVRNEDVQAALQKVARYRDEPERNKPDLPLVMYYRDPGITPDMNQHTVIHEAVRFINEKMSGSENCMDMAMRVTIMPLTLTYSTLFLAWDRPTLDIMWLAWMAYISPLYRKHSRFKVNYILDGDPLYIYADINAPRDPLVSDQPLDDGSRLWGARSSIEVNTQAIYGAKLEIPEYVTVLGRFELWP